MTAARLHVVGQKLERRVRGQRADRMEVATAKSDRSSPAKRRPRK